MKITVAGTGYVGLVTGVCLASIGHHVTCVDPDEGKITLLSSGQSPIFEVGLEELMAQNADRLHYTADFEPAYKNADLIIIAVGTPQKKDGSANLSQVYEAAAQISQCIQNETVVAVKSTVPIGTNDRIQRIIEAGASPGIQVHVASNPEFLAQGSAVYDTLNAPRIVIGTDSPQAEKVLREVYAPFHQEIIVTNRRSAEMIKYASNAFLALKISYINEIANLCEAADADIEEVALGMGMDPRIGQQFLRAGVGYGGSCFPKDTKALHWLSNFMDYELKTVKAAIEVNENQKLRLIKAARKYYENLNGLTVAVLGLTFKPHTDDLRDAPSLVTIPILLEDGAIIKAYDPVGVYNYQKIYPTEIQYCGTVEETILDADICFIFTEWDAIKQFKASLFPVLMKNPIIMDGRNCYDPRIMAQLDLVYESIGRKTVGKKAGS